MKDYRKWTRKEFEALPLREWEDVIECDSIVILPQKTMHDSGYRNMDFVAIQGDTPVCRCSGCSDVLMLSGICHKNLSRWSIDCLPVSGLLQVFCCKKLILGAPTSTFEVFVTPEINF